MGIAKLAKGTSVDALSRMDQSFDDDTLRSVIVAMAELGAPLSFFQATLATGIIASMIAPVDGKLDDLVANLGTTGTAGNTSVQALINGALKGGPVAIANTDADGITKTAIADAEFVKGDLIQLQVTLIPTAGADLTASLGIKAVDVV